MKNRFENKEYYSALIGTMLIIILITLAINLISFKEMFSFLWFIGAIDLIGTMLIMLYINHKFLILSKKQEQK